MESIPLSQATLFGIGNLLVLLALCVTSGCQSWFSTAALPGLQTTSDQRKILQQVDRDPFPSPGDVGIRGTE